MHPFLHCPRLDFSLLSRDENGDLTDESEEVVEKTFQETQEIISEIVIGEIQEDKIMRTVDDGGGLSGFVLDGKLDREGALKIIKEELDGLGYHLHDSSLRKRSCEIHLDDHLDRRDMLERPLEEIKSSVAPENFWWFHFYRYEEGEGYPVWEYNL